MRPTTTTPVDLVPEPESEAVFSRIATRTSTSSANATVIRRARASRPRLGSDSGHHQQPPQASPPPFSYLRSWLDEQPDVANGEDWEWFDAAPRGRVAPRPQQATSPRIMSASPIVSSPFRLNPMAPEFGPRCNSPQSIYSVASEDSMGNGRCNEDTQESRATTGSYESSRATSMSCSLLPTKSSNVHGHKNTTWVGR